MDRLLFEGESVEATVPLGSETVSITTHRVLAFPPGDGANLRAIERPNAVGARRASVADREVLPIAARVGAVAALFFLAGLAFDPEALIPMPDVGEAGETGPVADVLSPVEAMLGLFHALDLLLLVAGALAGAVALGLAAYQLGTRRQHVVIEVVGGEDVRFPAEGVDGEAINALNAALDPADW